ncbi:MAG: hypothetical protein FJ284_08705, partial [Planctomycetes bacterium]|nr:hypothetical protein [Planctomycetota bacterium]
GVMSISNLYVGLKTGWGLGVTVTSCIIAYAVFSALERIVPAWRGRHFTILENYTMSSAASAAGYMSSAGLVSALPALYLTTGRLLTSLELGLWLGAVSLLGVFMAIPLKRQLVNIDRLPFPSGIATAETLRSLHSAGAAAVAKARSLFVAAIAGGGLAIWRDLFPNVKPLAAFAFPGQFPFLPTAAARDLLTRFTLGIEGSLIMVAAGAIMGLRVASSMLLGAVICYGVIGPILVERGIAQPGYRGIVSWVLWPATSMMVTSGLLSFGLRWRTVVRAFGGLGRLVGAAGGRDDDPLARIEVPATWFVAGTLVAGAACVVLGHVILGSPGGWASWRCSSPSCSRSSPPGPPARPTSRRSAPWERSRS